MFSSEPIESSFEGPKSSSTKVELKIFEKEPTEQNYKIF